MRRLIATSLAMASLLALAGCERWALDNQMEELCKKDGGIKIYETVTLPATDFNQFGEPLGRYIQTAKSQEERFGPDYKYVEIREVIVGPNAIAANGEGQLTRWYHEIYRRSDGHLLGESVRYNRSGGDGFTFGFQPSGRSCPEVTKDLALAIFIKGN